MLSDPVPTYTTLVSASGTSMAPIAVLLKPAPSVSGAQVSP
jgi:alpha/beta superfamily hydrolase